MRVHPRFERILVVKIADLGDAVLTLPAIQALRRTFPTARLDVLTSPIGAQLYRLCPAVDAVLTLDKRELRRGVGVVHLAQLCLRLRRTRYDCVVLVHHLTTAVGRVLYRLLLTATGSPVRVGLDNGTGRFLTHPVPDRGFGVRAEFDYALELVRALGAEESPRPPYLSIPEAAFRRAHELLAAVPRPFLVLHPGVGPFAPARQWPIEYFVSLSHSLVEHGWSVVVTGTAAEARLSAALAALPGVWSLVGRTELPTLAAVLSLADLVIGADSGVIHLAAALRRPTIALFGPTNVEAWRPLDASVCSPATLERAQSPVIALTMGLPCSPCCYVGYRIGRPNGCSTRSCLTMLRPEIVSRAIAVVSAHVRSRQDSFGPSLR